MTTASERELPLQEPLQSAPVQAKASEKKKKFSYTDQLKQEFSAMFENLNLTPLQKQFLRSRWLDQILWMEGRAGRTQKFYYRLRLTTIVGGVIIPALVSLNINNQNAATALRWFTFGFSQIVAVSAATEQFFNYGERWRHYRRSVESLKTQGWQFFQLSGPYENYTSHEEAFRVFAGQVEDIIQKDVEVYSTQVSQPKKDEKQDKQNQDQGQGQS